MAKFPTLECRSTRSAAQAEVIPVMQDKKGSVKLPKATYGALLQRLKRDGVLTGKPKTLHFLRYGGRSKSHLMVGGLGSAATSEDARRMGASVYSKMSAEKVKSATVQVEHFVGNPKSDEAKERALAFAEGFALSAYRFDRHQNGSSSKKETSPEKLTLFTKNKKTAAEITGMLKNAKAAAETVHIARDWSNEPPNAGTPKHFAAEAKRLARQYGVKCQVMTPAEIRKEKMGCLLSVTAGSQQEPRVVVLDYKPAKAKKTIAFVGKGVTFDSGGISLKPSMRMEEMKHDMSGAATVFAATCLAARMKAPNRIITIMGFVENMPSGTATKPGSVVRSRSGKTVEIINTDAEGRLVLADLLDYVQKYKPKAIIDVATLTGAVGVALGKQCCALMGNSDDLMDSIRDASKKTSERVWQLPLFDEYFEDMKSDVADIKNSANNGLGGTIRAASFLQQFVKKENPWAHLDIAFTAWDLGILPYHPKRGASGAHVRMLAQWAADF